MRSAKREVPSDVKVETKTPFGKEETTVVTTVTEHFWTISHQYECVAFVGASETAGPSTVRVFSRSAAADVMTKTDRPPIPETRVVPPSDCDVTWLLAQLAAPASASAAPKLSVSIDRSAKDCVTPRRNKLVEEALKAAREFAAWGAKLTALHEFTVKMSTSGYNPSIQSALPSLASFGPLFVPVLPLMQPPESESLAALELSEGDNNAAAAEAEPSTAAADPAAVNVSAGAPLLSVTAPSAVEGGSGVAPLTLSADGMNRILDEERRGLAARKAALIRAFPPAEGAGSTLQTFAEAWLATLATHARNTLAQFREAMDYVEELLRAQLVSAIGKSLTPDDFAVYMRHHAHKLFHPTYAPRPFCFAVRQPERSPEGTVAIEMPIDGVDAPIETISRTMPEPSPPMTFSLDAATKVTFHGERHLHAVIAHAFGSGRHAQKSAMTLTVRARQFSSFLVLIGRLGPGGTFEPSHAMIARNKDELKIPLMLEQMPSAKEFRDAIASLSPEQQRFAQAYRAMQLEGSVFGLLVLQLKPQLEKLLRLPADSLTKEIDLTQKLLELFIEYQIPSDLLVYDGANDAPTSEKLDAVRQHVKAIYDTLEDAKKAEVDSARQQHAFANPGCWGGAMGGFGSDALAPPPLPAGGLCPPPLPGGGFGDAMGACGGGMGGVGESETMGGGMGGKGGKGGKGGGGVFARCATRGAPKLMTKGAPQMMAMSAPSPMAACAMAPPPLPAGGLPPPPTPAPSAASQKPDAAAPATPRNEPAMPIDDDFADVGGSVELDYTRLPAELDAKLLAQDTDSALRPTKIVVGDAWTKRAQAALLGTPTTATLSAADQKREKQRTFDLLDALSRSGSLPIECCSLHVVIAATHCFDDSLIDTVIVKNQNPIEKLERSALIVSETIQALPAPKLVRPDAYERVATYSAPALLPPRAAE